VANLGKQILLNS